MPTSNSEIRNPALVKALKGFNAKAVAVEIESLAKRGMLRPGSETSQSVALTLAMTLDLSAEAATAQVAKELRATMADLRCDATSDTLTSFLASLGVAVAVPAKAGNAAKSGSGNARAGGGKRPGGARSGAVTVAATRTGRGA